MIDFGSASAALGAFAAGAWHEASAQPANTGAAHARACRTKFHRRLFAAVVLSARKGRSPEATAAL
jgi:hypothetical protein